MYRGREGRHSRKYTGAWQWLGLARTWAVSEELVGGEEERKGGQILGASDITLRGLNQRKNVSLNDGLRSLFLSMVQGGRYPSAPDGFLPGRGGDKDGNKQTL